ncbi:LysM peptidoglycan-binding domain-containing protein [Pseudomonas aeruginosa]
MTESKICTCPSGDGSLVHPCPAHPAVEQAGANVGHGHVLPHADGVKMRCGGPGLCSECTADASRARAALAQPSPAQTQPSPAPTLRAAIDVANDRFEVPVAKWGTDLVGEEERPEVAEVAFVLRNIGAMDAEDIDGDNVDLRFEDAEGRDTGCDVSIVEYAEKAADLFEQHDRIVGELRADRDSWAEQAEQRLADWDEMRKERDAALARVAELERQEPVALANRGLHAFWVKWTEAAAGLYGPGIKLYAAPVAQAQHSVPAYVSYTTRPAESLAGIAIRQLKDESRWVEIRDINAHAFPDMQSHSYYPAGTVIKLPAAAPGKEVGHE